MCVIRMSDRVKSTSVVHVPKIRLSEQVDPRSARQVAEALGSGTATWMHGQAALAVADTLEALYTRIGHADTAASAGYSAR